VEPARAAIGVVIVSYNTHEELRGCLISVERPCPAEIVVADNASSDGSPAMVRAEFPAVRLIANVDNPGYGAAANQAISACTSPYVLLLNADTRLEATTLGSLTDYLDRHPRVAIVGPRLTNRDGSLQPSCHAFPTAAIVLLELTVLGRLGSRLLGLPGIRRWYPLAGPHDQPGRVDWVKGAALAIRREAFDEVGGFDRAFFLYWEETDLSRRLAAVGWETHFTPEATVVHAGAASARQHRAETAYRLIESLRRYSQKHHSTARRLALALTLRLILMVRLLQDRTRLLFLRDPDRRRTIAERVAVWSRALRAS
jgi:GT2 family glycosyltransferase